VIAPSLIPVASGDRVKTDRRDCRRLAELLRAGQLVAVRVPTEAEEGVRDLCRARTVLVTDVSRARHRLGSFLLRHGRVWPEPTASTWTLKHRAWVARQTFQDPAQRSTFDTYRALLMAREAELAGLEAQLQPWLEREPFVDAALRLGAYRGITRLGALAMAAEVGDWHRFGTAGGFAAFAGLTPSEYSSGDRIRRGHITRAGNGLLRTHLVESAWAYQHRPALGAAITRRQQGVPAQTCARAWKAQHYLCGKFRKLAARKDNQKIVVTAIARDLACFCWAEMNADRLT
jgi:transposase